MPAVITKGAMSAQGYGFAAPSTAANYIEDVFSTYLYTGTGNGTTGSQTITNGINLSTNGGMVWIKARNIATDHDLFDTSRGVYKYLISNNTDAQHTASTTNLTAFNSNGFSLGPDSTGNVNSNDNGAGAACTYASWTFRKQAKFFDVVTFTQSGTSGYQTINHNLGSTPGVIIIKGVGQADGWFVYHQSIPTQVTYLNQTNAAANYTLSNSVTSTTFNFNLTDFGYGNGATYVAYLFAHNAGGFGSAGTDNVITCGSFTGNTTVNLGYEPQWIMIKKTNAAGSWTMWDTMRGWSQTSESYLFADLSNAESSSSNGRFPNATGFTTAGYTPTDTFIYIAIRRGPMKTPTTGTSVFLPQSPNSSGSFPTVVTNFPVDMGIYRGNKTTTGNNFNSSRLQGGVYMYTNTTAAEATDTSFEWDSNIGWLALSGANTATWSFQRAPGFFDEVCYTGTGSATTQTHNLGVAPELMIVKRRDLSGYNWNVYSSTLGASDGLWLNSSTGQLGGVIYWNNTAPTTSVFSISSNVQVNASGGTYVAYLFATCAGVSKVGSYTGTGSTQTISCGFTGGARFVLIKRTDSTGDWYVWDTARGMVAGTDPYLLLDSTAGEVNANSVYTTTGGFQIVSTAAGINASGGTYIFWAVS